MTTQTADRNETFPYFGFAVLVLGYVATWIAVFLVSEDSLKAGGQAFVDDLDTGTNEAIFRVSAGLGMIAAASLVVFAIGLRRALDRRLTDSSIPLIIELSMIVTAAALFLGFIGRAMVFDTGFDYYGQAALPAMYAIAIDVPLAAWGALGLAAAGAAVASLSHGVFPHWFGYLSVLAVVLDVLLALTGNPYPMNFVGGVWLLAAAVVSMRL
ncbi:MAG TPA: hypothetical protein VMR52_08765 [Dehalococcoidia bacterium]|nr:hypothetical protein [Dehalococcoidia bacterium]